MKKGNKKTKEKHKEDEMQKYIEKLMEEPNKIVKEILGMLKKSLKST